MRNVFNTGKVKIGSNYEPPSRIVMGIHEERLQRALLDPRTAKPGMHPDDKGLLIIAAIAAIVLAVIAA